jgi:hypothetical protein
MIHLCWQRTRWVWRKEKLHVLWNKCIKQDVMTKPYSKQDQPLSQYNTHRKAYISLSDQKASRYLCSPDSDYPVRKMSLLYLILGQSNPYHILILSLTQEKVDDLQSVGSVS